MFTKLSNAIMFLLFILFFTIIFKYYSSSKNMYLNQKRLNINEIIKEKITDLPVLLNDTNNIIEFNNSLVDTTQEKKEVFGN